MDRSYRSSASSRSRSPSPFTSAPDHDSPTSSRSSVTEADWDESFGFGRTEAEHSKGYILVVGGLGYIGSHTTLQLLKGGYNVIVVDNMSNCFPSALTNIKALAAEHWAKQKAEGPVLRMHKLDFRSSSMRTLLGRYARRESIASSTRLSQINGVIHFAGFKSVEESTFAPLKYYQNNVAGLIDFLAVLDDFGIYNFVFSSSATVYGTSLSDGKPLQEELLVHHTTQLTSESGVPIDLIPGVKGLTSPYGRSKYFCEAILADVAYANPSWRITALRYFNPVGSEPSGKLGENPRMKATNLFPVISEVLDGSRPELNVFGSDWPTEDGTPVRDFIHVVDLADGHLAALATAPDRPPEHAFRAFNLGTGTGSTVAQVVSGMAAASHQKIPVHISGRRVGDVGYCVASTNRAASELGWKTQYSMAQAAADTWRCLKMAGRVLNERRESFMSMVSERRESIMTMVNERRESFIGMVSERRESIIGMVNGRRESIMRRLSTVRAT